MQKEIITINEGQVVTSSRRVAEDFGKLHKDVLDSIYTIIKAENSAVTEMFFETTYKAGTGKNYKEYLMNRDGFTLLAMGFTGSKAMQWKLKYMQAFNEMEKKIAENKPALPQTYLEALKELVVTVEALQVAENKIGELEPKAEFYEAVTQSETMMSVQDVAAVLSFKGMGRNNLFKYLKDKKVFITSNSVYRQHIDAGRFKLVEKTYIHPKTEELMVDTKIVVSQKGVDYIAKLLREDGYVQTVK